MIISDTSILETKAKLLGSNLLFTQTFYQLRTGREFKLSHPPGRESHYISIAREFSKVLRGETKRLIVNIAPRYGKTELAIHLIAQGMAMYPDSNFIYISYSSSLATKQTQTVRQIINLPHYRKIFGVEISDESSAKNNFETKQGGSVYAAGSGGTITGKGAGIKGIDDRFGGCILVDDIHKPGEVNSDTVREGIIDWFYNTLQSRVNGPNVPIIFIGQILHEDDLPSHLKQDSSWKVLSLPSLDEAGNALHPEMHTRDQLLKLKEESPYVFAAQHQQNPQPAGGGIFKPEWFYLVDEDPKILATFITADTAETNKDYNDATVFSFFGVYKIEDDHIETGLYGLHWIGCIELRVEPKDLESEFMAFYASCMRYHVKPMVAAIEKKSTGVTLQSVLQKVRGLRILDIDRTASSGNKTSRYLEIQPYVAAKQVSLLRHAKHTHTCIEHMRKITANNTHRHDDIADTLYDGVKLGIIDKVIISQVANSSNDDQIARTVMSGFIKAENARKNMYGRR